MYGSGSARFVLNATEKAGKQYWPHELVGSLEKEIFDSEGC